MSVTTSTLVERDKRKLAVVAFVFFLLGLLCLVFTLPDSLRYAGAGFELLALFYGIRAWTHRLARISVIGAGIFWFIIAATFVLFYLKR